MTPNVDIEIILNEYRLEINNKQSDIFTMFNFSFFSNNTTMKSIIGVVQKYLENIIVRPNSVINIDEEGISVLNNSVKTIIVGEIPNYVSLMKEYR